MDDGLRLSPIRLQNAVFDRTSAIKMYRWNRESRHPENGLPSVVGRMSGAAALSDRLILAHRQKALSMGHPLVMALFRPTCGRRHLA